MLTAVAMEVARASPPCFRGNHEDDAEGGVDDEGHDTDVDRRLRVLEGVEGRDDDTDARKGPRGLENSRKGPER